MVIVHMVMYAVGLVGVIALVLGFIGMVATLSRLDERTAATSGQPAPISAESGPEFVYAAGATPQPAETPIQDRMPGEREAVSLSQLLRSAGNGPYGFNDITASPSESHNVEYTGWTPGG